MQFAAQRTDEDLKPVGEPIEHFVTMTDEILPDPHAVLITGITPQMTRREGLVEAEFWREVYPAFASGDSTIMGFNTIRFDDEFLRYSLWRNLRDPYAWAYAKGNSRWDLIDVMRMMRALRPGDFTWPVDSDGRPSSRLETFVEANGVPHGQMHSALADVNVTIAVARLIRDSQPKLWSWLYELRTKKAVERFIQEQGEQPFVYTSGRYGGDHLYTSLVTTLAPSPRGNGVWVYDLRISPDEWLGKTDEELTAAFEARQWPPIKRLAFNRVPALAPLSTLDDASKDRLELDMGMVEKHRRELAKHDVVDFLKRLSALEDKRYETKKSASVGDADGQLYDGFLEDSDRTLLEDAVRADVTELPKLQLPFSDKRLPTLFLHYKARNYPQALTAEEQEQWEAYRRQRLSADYGMSLERFYSILQEKAADPTTTDTGRELLTELDLYAQSIAPIDD